MRAWYTLKGVFKILTQGPDSFKHWRGSSDGRFTPMSVATSSYVMVESIFAHASLNLDARQDGELHLGSFNDHTLLGQSYSLLG